MELHQKIDRLVKDIWKKQMKKDYNDCIFWEESVLKSAFYHHLRERISKDKTLKNLVLYPEMRVRSPKEERLRIDLAVVEIPECGIETCGDCDRRWKEHGSCIKRLIAVFEFKHWDRIYGRPLEKAVKKLGKHFKEEGVYYFDDNSKSRKLLTAEFLYFGIVLDNKTIGFPEREKTIGKPDSLKNLQLLIGGCVRGKLEFKCL
jgi:hypothetical protein